MLRSVGREEDIARMGDASARRRRGEGEVGWAQRQVRAVAGAGSLFSGISGRRTCRKHSRP
jgi:hypothetical protein